METLNNNQKEALNAASSGHNLLILGAAGTGKSFVIKEIIAQLEREGKTVALTCSTGIACHVYEHNLKATTVHRFCGLEDGRHDPSEIAALIAYSSKHQNVMKRILSTDTIIIDEISMISARTMQSVYEVLQLKDKQRPFGGIQIILSGDFMQLPPVKDLEYGDNGSYCFEWPLFRDLFPHKILLKQIHRQSDLCLIKAIEEISSGENVSEETCKFIKSLERELPASNTFDVTLFAKNDFVDDYNRKCILEMPGPLSVYKSEDSGDDSCLHKKMAPKVLWLKVGMPVILLRNLSEKLVNGLKGFVYDIDNNGPIFEFPDADIGYTRLERTRFDVYSPRLRANIASRTQYPVKPAFGITIHKAQGMTLERVTVDCRDIFQAGQLGVAVSRVKSTTGLRVINFHPRVCVTQPDIVKKFINEPSSQPCESLNCCRTQVHRYEEPLVSGISQGPAVEEVVESEANTEVFEDPFDDDFSKIIDSLDSMDRYLLDFDLPSDLSYETMKKEIICSDPVTPSQIHINEIFLGLSEYDLLCFCKKEYLFLTKLIDELKIDEPRSVPPKELAEFYSKVQKHMSSFEYNMDCISLFEKGEKTFQDDHKSICFQIHSYIRTYLLKQKANLYPSEQRSFGRRFLTNPSKGRVRYVAGYCVATIRHKFASKKETHRFSLSSDSVRVYEESCYAVSILNCLKESEQYLKANTVDESSLLDTERHQNITRGLTNVSDDTYNFFIKLSELCLSLLLHENLIVHGDNLFQFCFSKILENSELLDLFRKTASKQLENVNMSFFSATESSENAEMLQQQIKNVFKKLVKKYLMVQFVQFRKDIKSSFHVEKTMAHRKEIRTSKSKKLKTGSEKAAQQTTSRAQTSEPVCSGSRKRSVKRKKAMPVKAGSYVNEAGETVWVCPSCGEEDDGQIKMIGCDMCEEWFHWTCVNILEEPQEEMWYCPDCAAASKKRKKRTQ